MAEKKKKTDMSEHFNNNNRAEGSQMGPSYRVIMTFAAGCLWRQVKQQTNDGPSRSEIEYQQILKDPQTVLRR